MEVLKIAVVGTGGRAGSHLATIPKLKDRYELVAVCDLDEARAKAAAERHVVACFTDVEQLLDRARPDVVLIAVPPEGHHTIVAQAAERGIHAISETPMSFSLAAARRMLRDAERHHTLLEVSENVRRWPMERFKRVVIDSGALGQLMQVQCWYASGVYHGISAVRNAVGAPATRVVGHAQNVQLGTPYWFDPFIRRSVGEAPDTPAAPATPGRNARVATWELGVVSFANGVQAVYQYPIGAVRGNYWEIFLTGGEIIAGEFFRYGDGRPEKLPVETVYTEVEGVQTIDHIRLGGTETEVVWENPHKAYPLADADDIARADVLLSIHRAATEGVELDYGGIGGYRDMEIMVATRESALRDNAPITLPIDEELAYDRIQHAHYAERYGNDPFEAVATADWKQEAKISAEIVKSQQA